MDFGIALATAADSWKVVARAEALGFSHAWFYDTQLLNADVFVAMAAAAMKTSRIRLGTGVLIPSNRIAPVAASAFGALNKLAPGRIDFGVGTGFTGRRTMGLGAIKLDEMRRYIEVVQALLAEETVQWDFEGQSRKIRFLNPDLQLINTRQPIALHVSAFGPRARRLAAELGAGWLNFVTHFPRALADIADMAEVWAAAGRDADALYGTAFTLGCVLAEGEPADGPRAIAQAGPLAAVFLHGLAETRAAGGRMPRLPDALAALVEGFYQVYQGYQPADARYLSVHRGHLMFVRPEERRFITAELIRARTFTGPAAELRERIRALRDAGYRQWTIQIVEGQEAALDDWADLIAGI